MIPTYHSNLWALVHTTEAVILMCIFIPQLAVAHRNDACEYKHTQCNNYTCIFDTPG